MAKTAGFLDPRLALLRDYNDIQWHWLMAASIVSTLPCLLVFAIAQRWFVRGIATSGLKGLIPHAKTYFRSYWH